MPAAGAGFPLGPSRRFGAFRPDSRASQPVESQVDDPASCYKRQQLAEKSGPPTIAMPSGAPQLGADAGSRARAESRRKSAASVVIKIGREKAQAAPPRKIASSGVLPPLRSAVEARSRSS